MLPNPISLPRSFILVIIIENNDNNKKNSNMDLYCAHIHRTGAQLLHS